MGTHISSCQFTWATERDPLGRGGLGRLLSSEMAQLRKVVARESEGRRRDKLSAINRELDAMSDWELERGLASSLGFDHDQRTVANRILRERYAGSEAGVSGDGGRGGPDRAA